MHNEIQGIKSRVTLSDANNMKSKILYVWGIDGYPEAYI